MSVTATITKDTATPALQKAWVALAWERIGPVIGRAGASCVRDHLFAFDKDHPNKLGGSRTHFYANCAKSTYFDLGSQQATIHVSETGGSLRFFGGGGDPVNASLLTIPAIAEAYGKRAREFFNLQFGFAVNKFGVMQPCLADTPATKIKITRRTSKKTGVVYFWLTPHVNIPPTPDMIPDDQQIGEAVGTATENHFGTNLGYGEPA